VADKSPQELDAIRRAFGRTAPSSTSDIRASETSLSMSSQQRRAYEQKLRAAQARAAAAL